MRIERFRGDTKRIRRQVVNGETGEPIDITGHSFKMTLNSDDCPEDTTDEVFSINAQIEDATKGLIYFPFTETHADNLGEFFFDIAWTDSVGEIQTLEKGAIIFIQDIGK